MGPLSGITVLDLTTEVMGPLATQMLGDFGANIIKVESIDGDPQRKNGVIFSPGMSSIYLAINRNKQSISVDLKTQEGKDILNAIIPSVDIIIHNIRIPAIQRLGFDYETVIKLNPEIIYCVATGYDQSGPLKDKPAFDEIIQAGCGLADINAHNDTPEFIPVVIADKTTGTMIVTAVLAALFSKERTGKGQYIEVPMFETMVANTLLEHMGGMVCNPTKGDTGYARILPGGRSPCPTKDGYIAMLPYTVRHWEELFNDSGFKALGIELGINNRITRAKNTQKVYSALHAITSSKTTQEWLEICEILDIPASRIYTLLDLLSHPQLVSTELFKDVEHPVLGNIRYLRPTVKFSSTPAGIRCHAPELGKDTEEILKGIGYTHDEIVSLTIKNIIKTTKEIK